MFHLSVVIGGGDGAGGARGGDDHPDPSSCNACVDVPCDAAVSEESYHHTIRMYQETRWVPSGSGDAPQAPPRQPLVGYEVNANHMHTDPRMITTPSPYCSLHGYCTTPFLRAQSCMPSPAPRHSESAPSAGMTTGETGNPHQPDGCMVERFTKMGLNVADR